MTGSKHIVNNRGTQVKSPYKPRSSKKQSVSSSIVLPLLSKERLGNLKSGSYKDLSLPRSYKKANITPMTKLMEELRSRHDGSKVSSLLDPLSFVM